MNPQPTLPSERDGYVPWRINFDKLADDIRTYTGEDALPEALHGMVDDALRHVRDENTMVDDLAAGRVLMTAAVLVQFLEADSGFDWNGRQIANLISALGQRLWDAGATTCIH
ncbi:MAG: hypothetical protein ACRDNS_19135, partial [Trebonia sp.]